MSETQTLKSGDTVQVDYGFATLIGELRGYDPLTGGDLQADVVFVTDVQSVDEQAVPEWAVHPDRMVGTEQTFSHSALTPIE